MNLNIVGCYCIKRFWNLNLHIHKVYKQEASSQKVMQKTTLTLSEPVAKTLKVYTVQSKSSLRAQSQVVEEALIEFFEKHDVKIEG
jgi:hypothetical protein